MNVFYEEQGEFKVGAVLADNDTSLQVETASGKRAKVKSANVLLRFSSPPISGFMAEAQRRAEELDPDFLWQCCGENEFGFESLGREYYGHDPDPLEAAGLVLRLHAAPMYFYRRGKGRFKAAPEEALRAALAGLERKRQQAALQQAYLDELLAGRMPEAFVPIRDRLLYRPDRNTVEVKALEAACDTLRLAPARLFERIGALPSTHDYHVNRFLYEHFPQGAGFPPGLDVTEPPADLPEADVVAYSIDDASTTEIDDAFSIVPLPEGGWRLGVHIAAPALGISPEAPLDDVARARLSTVYFPGGKFTMLPAEAIERYTLRAGEGVPAVSMYATVSADLAVLRSETRVERIRIAENLRHDTLDAVFNEATVRARRVDHPWGDELLVLHDIARRLEQGRGRPDAGRERAEYNIQVADDRVTITERRRGSPIDKVVSELMILVNTEWARALDGRRWPGVFRAQADGRVKLTTVASPHQGLGVEQYVWASSPLRRYVDLINQRQIVAFARDEPPPYPRGSDALFAAMRAFELAYEAYAEFQRSMERYWCLRWLLQENVASVTATVIRETLIRLDNVPLVLRAPSVPDLPSGTRIELAVGPVDLLDLDVECEYRQTLAS